MLQGEWTLAESPDVYTGAWFSDGTLPGGEYVVDTTQLATVHARYAPYLALARIETSLGIAAFRVGVGGYGYSSWFAEFPLERNKYYYSSHEACAGARTFGRTTTPSRGPTCFSVPRVRLKRGALTLFATTLRSISRPWPTPGYLGCLRVGRATFYRCSRPRTGTAACEGYVTTTGVTRLYRDSELFSEVVGGDGGQFEVPPGLASYRVEIDTAQSLPSGDYVSLRVSAHDASGNTVEQTMLRAYELATTP